MMRAVISQILILLWSWLSGYNMSSPQLRLPIQSVHFDAAGDPVEHQPEYILEWLRRNYVLNGGFEQWASTDPDNWENYGMVKSTSEHHAGANSAKASGEMSYCMSGFIPVDPLKTYRVCGYFKSTSPTTLAYDVALEFYNSSQVQIQPISLQLSTVTSDWTAKSRIYTPSSFPAGTAYVRLYVYCQADDVFADDISFTVYNPGQLETYADFTTLKQDSEETFTFPGYPLVGSVFDGEDDPSQDIESISGHLRIEQDRYPRREMNIKLRLTTKESLKQLRRFHAKTRGLTFTYVDHEGVSHSVRWRGGFSAPPMQTNTDIYIVTLPLIHATVTNGA